MAPRIPLEGVVAPRAHHVRTVATASGQTPVHHTKMQPPKQAIEALEKLSACKHKTCLARLLYMVANESQRLLGSFCSFLEAS